MIKIKQLKQMNQIKKQLIVKKSNQYRWKMQKVNDNVTISNNIGKEVTVPSACKDSSTNKVTATVNNFVKDFKKLSEMGEGQVDKIDQLIKDTSKTITTGVNGLVGDISENVVGELTGQVQQGLQVLYEGVFNQCIISISKPCSSTFSRCSSTKSNG